MSELLNQLEKEAHLNNKNAKIYKKRSLIGQCNASEVVSHYTTDLYNEQSIGRSCHSNVLHKKSTTNSFNCSIDPCHTHLAARSLNPHRIVPQRFTSTTDHSQWLSATLRGRVAGTRQHAGLQNAPYCSQPCQCTQYDHTHQSYRTYIMLRCIPEAPKA